MLRKHNTIFAHTIIRFKSLHSRKLNLYYSSLVPHKPSNPCHPENDLIPSKRHNNAESIVFYNTQITKFGRTGKIRDAEAIFDRMQVKSTVTWTALLTAYEENGRLVSARKVFDEMPQRNIASWNAMITGYVRNGLRVGEAFELFKRMPERNAVSYAAMITGCARAGLFEEAERLYGEMPVTWRDPVCGNALVCGYLKVGALEEAVRVFTGMVEKDVVSWTSVVDGYCRKGLIGEARKLFDMMPEKNVVSWTVMINGYMKVEDSIEGFLLFLTMRREGTVRVNPMTLTTIVDACANYDMYREGCQIHGLVSRMGFEYDIILNNSIINMYGKLGCVDAANKFFHLMSKKDIVSWNSLLASYLQANKLQEACSLFQIMHKKDIVSWTTMVVGFSGKGYVAKSISLFNLMPKKDDVAWTAVISGCVNNEQFTEAIQWYMWMTQNGSFRPNVLTLSSVICAAAGVPNLVIGSQLHAHAVKMHMEFELSVQNSLVSMYSKCGNISDAYRLFTCIHSPNIVSFNSIITAFAHHGLGQESLNLFNRMQNEGQKPNEITFLGVLSACTHMGLVEEGQGYFKSMRSAYHIEPGPNHYACMIDLLGRAGLLDQAVSMISAMPFEPHGGVWGALLSASCSHLRLDLATLATEQLLKLEPENATPLVVLSNLYSMLGLKDAKEIRMAQKLKWTVKSPGCSWVLARDNSY